ncbi:MAG: hypothetical protein U9Q75_06185 [Pseudomonadota bacterium]|nr:hypothetical protein [Pseudomonadota bacterium]
MCSLKAILLLAILPLFLASCDMQHSGYTSKEYSGDYRVYAGIAEFFDCDEQMKYYVSETGVHAELAEKYAALGMPEKDDVYIKVEGYLKKESQMDGIDPITVFVPTKFISFDKTRGCEMGRQQGY